MSFRLPTFGFFLLLLLTACGQVGSPTALDLEPAAITGGSVVAWGRNDYGQINVPALPEGVSYTAVEGGFEHSLAVRSDGQVVAWGSNSDGQTTVPALPEGTSYTAVAGGSYHSVGLRSDGQVVAWGQNNLGQTDVPALPEDMSYTDVAAGSFHNLAVRSDGQVVAWGYNSLGQTDVPALPEGLRYTDVAGGAYHSLAVRSDGQVVAWGYNDYGQTDVPALPAGVNYTSVAAGDYHSMAVRSDGQAVAWGRNDYGQADVPALPAGVSYTSVAGGGFHSVALRNDGQAVAWGYNRNGQTNVPDLPEGSKYLGVAAGGNHSLAIIQKPKQDQTISFTSTAPTNATVGGSYTPTATATSGLSVTFGTSTPSTCTFSSGTVSFVAAGTCTVTADQGGNEGYKSAPQISQSFTISSPPAAPDPYTIDFETAPANRILYSVKVGQGVVYGGQGSASSASVPVVGKRANNGKILEAQVARVVSLYGSKRLIIGSSASSNTPSSTGGRIKLTFTNYNPAGAKLTSMTLSNLTKRGAYLTFYSVNGSSSRQNLGTTTAGGSLIVPLAVENLRAVDVYAPNAYAIDDVKFEVTSRP